MVEDARLKAGRADKSRIILIASLAVLVYFALMVGIAAHRNQYPLIGVFIELMTLPAFVLLVALIVISTVQWVKQKFRLSSYPFFSLSILLITILLIWFLS
jgi:hypothetical protein